MKQKDEYKMVKNSQGDHLGDRGTSERIILK
jgi:hypothetical protein